MMDNVKTLHHRLANFVSDAKSQHGWPRSDTLLEEFIEVIHFRLCESTDQHIFVQDHCGWLDHASCQYCGESIANLPLEIAQSLLPNAPRAPEPERAKQWAYSPQSS